jgi:hypothetical protein
MIVKTKNNMNSWNYYEGDAVKLYGTDKHNEELASISLSLVDHEKDGDAVFIELEKDGEPTSCILTNQLTYLLNDEGKTIDKLI